MFGKKRELRDELDDTLSAGDGLDYDAEIPEESYSEEYPEDVYYNDDDAYEDYDENGEYYDEYDEDDGYYDEEYDGPRRKTVGRTVAYMLVVLLISAAAAVAMWFAADDVLALTKPDNVITITVAEGDTLDDVAQNLKDHGLVNYKFLFLLYGRFSHAEDKIGTGTFELNQQFDYHALVNGLASSSDTRMTVTLTFPEGYTCSQIFASLEENGVCTVADLEETAANYDFDYEFLADRPYGEANRLEG